MRKLEATNRIEAVRKATALGLIEGVAPPSGDERAPRPDTLMYNESGRPARQADLKVTPLKIDKLVVTPEPPPDEVSRSLLAIADSATPAPTDTTVGQALAPHSRSKRPPHRDRDRAEKQAESEDE